MIDALWRNIVPLALVAAVLILAFVAVPLAVRDASATVWRVHGLLALFVAAALTFDAYRKLFVDVVPWWKLGLFYAVCVVLPLLGGAWAGRQAVRLWPTARWSMAVLAVCVFFVAGALVGTRITRGLLPDMVRAVKST